MKGNPKVIQALNQALTEELTAINQYFLHAEMCENWKYDRLAKHIKKQSIDEMKHAEALIERILFLDGTPDMTESMQIKVGPEREGADRERPQIGDQRGGDVQQASNWPARKATTPLGSSSRNCCRTKSSMWTGWRRSCTRSKRSATSATWRARSRTSNKELADRKAAGKIRRL